MTTSFANVARIEARIEGHIKKGNKSHIFKQLHSTTTCFDWYNSRPFKIIDKANSKFDIKFKEALHIVWRKPNLNTQQNHLTLIPLFLPVFVFVVFLLSIFFIISGTNYQHLLLS